MMRKEKKKETKKKTCKTSKAFFILPLSLYLRRFRANKFVNWQTCQEKKKNTYARNCIGLHSRHGL